MARTERKPAPSPDEAEIRALLERWAKTLESRDLSALTTLYDPDVLLFDVKPPFQIRGVDAYCKMWEDCLPYFPQRFAFERRQVEICVGGGAAFAHFLTCVRAVGEPPRGGETMWLRATICFRRSAERWWVSHEHVSTPFDPTTGKAVVVTEADVAALGV